MTERTTLGRNRKAFHEYEVDDKFESGIVLSGTEVKSIRAHSFSFTDAYARIRNGELWLIGLHVSEYRQGNINNHEPTRDRKLLCRRDEIERLRRRVDEKGFTLIPLELYMKGALIKVEIGVCKGKRLYDKRESLKRKDEQLDMDRAIKDFR